MMNQVQCGAAVTKVSDIARPTLAPATSGALVHSLFPETHQAQQSEDHRARHGKHRALLQVPRRELWVPGKAVHFWLIHQEIERVQAAQRPAGIGAVELRPGLTLRVQLLDSSLRALPQLSDRPELDGIGGTSLGARGLQAHA